jgi:hypothetical protein
MHSPLTSPFQPSRDVSPSMLELSSDPAHRAYLRTQWDERAMARAIPKPRQERKRL